MAALLVHVVVHRSKVTRRDSEDSLEEFARLMESADLQVVGTQQYRLREPRAATWLGKGAVEAIAAAVVETQAKFVCLNHALTPLQQRNLEIACKVRVVDRPALILDIFALRAKSHEGKLQVELAQLQHQAARLVRGWTHLERQKGGIGVRGGPGEKQIELDRRLILQKVSHLQDRLRRLEQHRALRRRARRKQGVFHISLVGYTNAGKSTLFNALTRSGVYADARLFSTLDPVVRRIYLGLEHEAVLTDTVGFIRDLPHDLVAAFHATLEETTQADILLHVVDSASANADDQIRSVNSVLAEIGADSVRQIKVWNKCDVTGMPSGVERDGYGRISDISCSAASGAGLRELREALAESKEESQQVPLRVAGGSELMPWLPRTSAI